MLIAKEIIIAHDDDVMLVLSVIMLIINMMTFYAYIMIMFGLLWPVIYLCFQCDELR